MTGGPLLAARVALQYGRPWQRVVILAVLICGGIALIATGDFRGIVLVAFGLLFAAICFPRLRPIRRAPHDGDAPAQDDPVP